MKSRGSHNIESDEALSRAQQVLLRLSVMDVGISTGTKEALLREMVRLSDHTSQSAYVCFVNVHMIVEANQDQEFRTIVNNADVTCPDGRPVAKSIEWFYAIKQPQMAGPDTLPLLLIEAGKLRKRIFVLGSTEDVLERFVEVAALKFPDTVICGYDSPPFRALTQEEDEALIRKINDSGADMIFVALGCPKQERWMASHRGKVQGCMFGLGYAIPVFAGVAHRAPRWMIDIGLEWSFRLFSNPRRLLRRYVETNSIFMRRIVIKWVISRWERLFLPKPGNAP
jgi:N-acetylglucosaminyldiphosphoundecaprenol N-acetyl-beta-D-mannosaminyltransferase